MVSVTHDGMTVTTNTGDEASVRASMGMPVEAVDPETPEAPASAEPADPEPEAEASTAPAEPEKPKKAKPRDNPQARIAQVLEQKRLAEARAQQLEAELQAIKAKPAPIAAEPPAPTPERTRQKPREEEVGTKYPTYADFIEDLADWKAEQRFGAQPTLDQLVEEKLAAREQQRQLHAQWQAHQDRIAVVHARHPELQVAIDAADQQLAQAGLTLSPAAISAVIGSDRSGDMVEWLATHPADYLQLARDTARLDVTAAPLVRQLLEARLGSVVVPGSGPPATQSRAQPPIKPVGATPPTATPDEDADDEPIERWIARKNAADRKAGRL